MKKKLYISLLLCFTLFVLNCENEDNSHYYIQVENRSEIDVYLTRRGLYNHYCMMDLLTTIKKDSVFQYQPYNTKIERQLGGNRTIELYIVNPDHFNNINEYYDCDSLAIKNDILKHYKLTLEDLQRMNWKVVYPPIEE